MKLLSITPSVYGNHPDYYPRVPHRPQLRPYGYSGEFTSIWLHDNQLRELLSNYGDGRRKLVRRLV